MRQSILSKLRLTNLSLLIGIPQVHACNILRAMYRETKLGEDVFPFVSDGVVVAVTGFHSNSWAVSYYRCLCTT